MSFCSHFVLYVLLFFVHSQDIVTVFFPLHRRLNACCCSRTDLPQVDNCSVHHNTLKNKKRFVDWDCSFPATSVLRISSSAYRRVRFKEQGFSGFVNMGFFIRLLDGKAALTRSYCGYCRRERLCTASFIFHLFLCPDFAFFLPANAPLQLLVS